MFLEDQTEGLVQSIQSLHASARNDANPGVIKSILESIASIVGKMVSETQHTTQGTGNSRLREQADPVIDKLAVCRTKVMAVSAKLDGVQDAQTWSQLKETLPPLGFDVARESKELVQRLDQLDGGV